MDLTNSSSPLAFKALLHYESSPCQVLCSVSFFRTELRFFCLGEKAYCSLVMESFSWEKTCPVTQPKSWWVEFALPIKSNTWMDTVILHFYEQRILCEQSKIHSFPCLLNAHYISSHSVGMQSYSLNVLAHDTGATRGQSTFSWVEDI